jgi:hypothetical protein
VTDESPLIDVLVPSPDGWSEWDVDPVELWRVRMSEAGSIGEMVTIGWEHPGWLTDEWKKRYPKP